MAVTATVYNSYKAKLLDSSTKISLPTDTIKLALVTSSYTPNIDTHDFWDDVSANEASGTGYTAGGSTLTTPAVTTDTTNDKGKFTADTVSWTISSSLTARYAVLYKSTGTASTSPLIAYIDFGGNVTLAAGTLSVTWNANGTVTVA